MSDNMERVGALAEVATASAAVTYPVVRLIDRWLERRRDRLRKQITASVADAEARLVERFRGIENRLDQMEQKRQRAA
jgi:hypothetical protein